MKMKDVNLYRMTHIENIPHILKHGITHKTSGNSCPDFTPIGDVSLIDNRSSKEVNITNGEEVSGKVYSIVLGDFIPFYFGVKMPMLYIVQIGGNFVEKATAAEDIIYLVCPLDKIVESGFTYYYSDGHATNNFTTFFDETKINDLSSIVDWTAVRTSYWAGDENLNLKRKKQAEFLVKDDIPADNIYRYGCYNDTAKKKLVSFGISPDKIKVIKDSYF